MRINYSSRYFPFSLLFTLSFTFCINLSAQLSSTSSKSTSDSANINAVAYYKNQKDLIDIFYKLFHKDTEARIDSTGINNTNLYFSIAPIVEFTIATGFSPGVAGNVAFKTSVKQKTNTSSFLGAIKYTQKKQFLIPIQSSVWTPGNKFNLVGDWRYLNYPQDAYGFGGYTKESDKYIIDYKYIRFYELVLKSIRKNLYAGIGYQLDYHWGIRESEVQAGRITDFQKYGFSNTSVSSAIAFDLLYDTRENSINPRPGNFYANLQFVQNSRMLGANSNWNSVTLDLRKYIKMPLNTVLALWCFSVFSLSGNPPYLDLPGTGSDTYNNTGRGYEQARFIGKKMIDLEAEIRFKISKNGLLGGVIFGNAESLSELGSNKFEVISPAIGLGLRIKFNKFSNTNAAIDYGIGSKGSKGFVGNLGEVF